MTKPDRGTDSRRHLYYTIAMLILLAGIVLLINFMILHPSNFVQRLFSPESTLSEK